MDTPSTAAILGATGSSSPSGIITSASASVSLPPPKFYEKDSAAVSDELREAVLPEYSLKLEAIFASGPWIQRSQPLDVTLIKAMLRKVRIGPSHFECPFRGCPKEDTHATKATEHIEEHLGHRGFVCDICHATFRRCYERDSHRDRHNRGPPVYCPQCNASFVDTKNVARHLRENCPLG